MLSYFRYYQKQFLAELNFGSCNKC